MFLARCLTLLAFLVPALSHADKVKASRRPMKALCLASVLGQRVPDQVATALKNLNLIGTVDGKKYRLEVKDLELESNAKYLVPWEIFDGALPVGAGSIEVGANGDYFSDFRSNIKRGWQGNGLSTQILGCIAQEVKAGASFSLYSLNQPTNRALSAIRATMEADAYFPCEIDDAVLAEIRALVISGKREALPLWIRALYDQEFDIERLEARPAPGQGAIRTGTETYRMIFRKKVSALP